MTHEIDELRLPPGDETADACRLREQALLCLDRGRYDEAERLFRCALDIVDAVLGHDHLEAAVLYYDLGALEHARGRTAERDALVRWGLRIRERDQQAIKPSGRS